MRKQMFSRLQPQETLVKEAKVFLNLFRNILLPRQRFPRLRSEVTFRETMFLQQYGVLRNHDGYGDENVTSNK